MNTTPEPPGSTPPERTSYFPAGLSKTKPTSIVSELLDWMMVPLLVIVPLALWLSYTIAQNLAGEVFDNNLRELARAVGEQVVFDDEASIPKLAIDLRVLLIDSEVDSHAYRIDTADGKVVGADDLPAPTRLTRNRSASGERSRIALRDATWRDEKVRIAELTITPANSPGPITLQLAQTKDKSELLAREMLLRLLPLQFATLVLAVLMAWIGVRRGIQPLLQLSSELQARPRGDLQPINPRHAPAEIAPLVEDFNTLIANARSENERRQRFIDNAAHQLRTPLAGLSLTTDLALRATNADEKDTALRAISAAAQRASNAVTQLLMLTRAEHGESLARAPLEVRSLLQTVLADYVSAASGQNIDLGMQDETAQQPMNTSGDAVLLREMLTNLLDNALRHTPTGGTITLSLREVIDPTSGAPFAEIDIEDSGSGIDTEEREKVFERFYRGSNPSKSGTGLGLAIVREIATAHGGSVAFITPSELGGARARIRLPLDPPRVE